MRKSVLFTFLAMAAIGVVGGEPDIPETLMIAELKERYPDLFQQLTGGYRKEEDQWCYIYECNKSLHCGFTVCFKDDKYDPHQSPYIVTN